MTENYLSFEPREAGKINPRLRAPEPSRARAGRRGRRRPELDHGRDERREGETLRTHASRKFVELARTLDRLELLETSEREVDRQPAVFMRYTWMFALGPLEQTG